MASLMRMLNQAKAAATSLHLTRPPEFSAAAS
jgi:hypothetical protein